MMTGHKKAPVVTGALKRRRSVFGGLETQKLAHKKYGDQYKNSDWNLVPLNRARGKHIVSQYFEAFPGHAAKLDQPLDGTLRKRWDALVKKHNLSVPSESKTRGDWIREVFALSRPR